MPQIRWRIPSDSLHMSAVWLWSPSLISLNMAHEGASPSPSSAPTYAPTLAMASTTKPRALPWSLPSPSDQPLYWTTRPAWHSTSNHVGFLKPLVRAPPHDHSRTHDPPRHPTAQVVRLLCPGRRHRTVTSHTPDRARPQSRLSTYQQPQHLPPNLGPAYYRPMRRSAHLPASIADGLALVDGGGLKARVCYE